MNDGQMAPRTRRFLRELAGEGSEPGRGILPLKRVSLLVATCCTACLVAFIALVV